MSCELVDHYLNELRSGDSENAWHSLVEMGKDIVPRLIAVFRSESEVWKRAIDALARLGSPECAAALAKAMEARSGDKQFREWAQEAMEQVQGEHH